MPKLPEPKVHHTVIIAIVMVFVLECLALANGMNGVCMRTSMTTIGALAGVGGGWGLKAILDRKRGDS